MRVTLLACLLLLVLPIANGCRRAWAENPRHVELDLLATQTYDSLGVIVAWSAGEPPNARQYPVAGHNIEVRETVSDTVLVSSYVTSALVDTLWMVMPAIGDTVEFYGAVNAQDVKSMVSGWAASPSVTWVTTPLAPNAPGGVTVDTAMGTLIIDSIQVLAERFTIGIGDTVRLAAVLYSGPWPVECCCPALTDPPDTHPCDDVTLVDLGSVLPPQRPAFKYVQASRVIVVPELGIEERGTVVRSWYVNAWRLLGVDLD